MVTPGGGEEPSPALGRVGRQYQHGARADIFVSAHQPGSGRDRSGHLDGAGHRLRRVLDHHDRVGALGHHRAGRDRHARAGRNRDTVAEPMRTAPAG